jgi:charged multivesicular body protein 7
VYRAAAFVVGRPLWWTLEQLNLVSDGGASLSAEERWRRARGDYVIKSVLEVRISTIGVSS